MVHASGVFSFLETFLPSTYVQYRGDGSNRNFAVTFPYLARDHVKVTVDEEATAQFVWLTDSMIQLATAPASDALVDLRRQTPRGTPVDFEDGSVLAETDLDLLATYTAYLSEEARDGSEDSLKKNLRGLFDSRGLRLSNLAEAAEPQDAVTKAQMDSVKGDTLNAVTPLTHRAESAAQAAEGAHSQVQAIANQFGDVATAVDLAGSSALAAAVNAADSATRRDEATQAATTAVLAADAALIQAGVYPDEPTGRAGSADGKAFKVQGTGDIAAYEFRRINSTTSELIAIYPSAAAVERSKLENNGIFPFFPTAPFAWAVADSEGSMALGIDANGKVILPGGVDQLAVAGSLIRDCLPPWVYAICDKDGYVVWGIKEDGTVFPSGGGNGGNASYSPADLQGLMLVPVYGQSLSMGGPVTADTPPLGTSTLRALAPNTGAQTWNKAPTSLSPLAEAVTETVCSSLAHNFIKAVTRERGFDGKKFMTYTGGVSGYALDALAPGTAPFAQLVDVVRLGKQQASAMGIPLNVLGHVYIQGEANALVGTPQATYRAGIEALQAAFEDYCRSISGQSASVPMFIDQLSSHPYYAGTIDHPSYEIPLAQLEAALTGSRIQLATPMYIFPYTDAVHLKNHGYRWLAAYMSKALMYWLTTGKPWRPLHPILAKKVDSTTFDVEFSVPAPPLVFDTSIVTELLDGKHGFEVWNNGVRLSVSSVTLIGPATVRVVTSTPVVSGDQTHIAYALTADVRGVVDGGGHYPSYRSGPDTGARGTLRDSDPTLSNLVNASGVAYPLHNYCVTFKQLVE